MVKRKQPARMGTYTNLGTVKHTTPRRKHKRKYPRPVAWFLGLSWPKRILLIVGIFAVILIAIAIATYVYYANDIKDPERLMNRNNTGLLITDMNDKTIYSTGRAEHRNVVQLANISQDMQHALIASEDKDFYKHGGFSVFSIIRASTSGYGGGSTITQQLAKNTLLSDQHSILRKWQELAVAVAIEQNYSKDQILDMYLNSVYFGEGAFGIEDAAKTYFGTTPDKLDLAQSAMLVGLLPAPSAYSPISGNKDYAKERQTTVLTRMVTNGYITEAQKTAALAEQLTYVGQTSTLGGDAPHFALTVREQLIEKYGEETALRSGYQVKTTLNLDAQKIVQDSINDHMAYINANGGTNASALVVDPKTGEVRAYVGSADWSNEKWGKVDMVTTARQPGSSFKTIYYAGALADGVITPASQWKDELTDFGGGYTPYNADRKWHGTVTTRSAIAMSLNIPSVAIMQKYGIDKSVQTAKNLGITTLDANADYGLSLALGSAEVPLSQMTNAYAALANQGQQYSLTYIKSIEDKFDKVIYTASEKPKLAINQSGAYLISSILSDNAARAPIFGSSLTVSGHTVAVKTGTTNDDRDAWTIGYTPSLAMGVWVGNNDNSAMKNGGSLMGGPIWKAAMQKMLSGKADEAFTQPASVVSRAVCKSNGGLAIKSGSNTYNEYFMTGALPTNTCNAEPVMISVCNLATLKIESVDETNYNDTSYSKDANKCNVSVCDTTTGQVVSITNDTYQANKAQYSTNTTNCTQQTTTADSVVVCDMQATPPVQITITAAQLAADTQNRYSTNLASCGGSTAQTN